MDILEAEEGRNADKDSSFLGKMESCSVLGFEKSKRKRTVDSNAFTGCRRFQNCGNEDFLASVRMHNSEHFLQ
jgi:uncharacterized ParB-like nuclease family protein